VGAIAPPPRDQKREKREKEGIERKGEKERKLEQIRHRLRAKIRISKIWTAPPPPEKSAYTTGVYFGTVFRPNTPNFRGSLRSPERNTVSG